MVDFLAQLTAVLLPVTLLSVIVVSTAISCAITSHPSVHDFWCCCWCQHCGQKLTSKLNAYED